MIVAAVDAAADDVAAAADAAFSAATAATPAASAIARRVRLRSRLSAAAERPLTKGGGGGMRRSSATMRDCMAWMTNACCVRILAISLRERRCATRNLERSWRSCSTTAALAGGAAAAAAVAGSTSWRAEGGGVSGGVELERARLRCWRTPCALAACCTPRASARA